MGFLKKIKQKNSTLTLAEVKALCPSCGEKMEANGMKYLDISDLLEETTAAIEDNPGKWEKYWKSLTGKAEHKFTKCIKKLKGHKEIKNPEGLCGKLKSKFG